MKYIILFITLFFNVDSNSQTKSGTFFQNGDKKNSRFLRIKYIDSSIFIFGFSSDSSKLSFNTLSDYGIAHKIKGKWIGIMDYSYMDREFGDFLAKEKAEKLSFYIKLEFITIDKKITVKIIESNTRNNVAGIYSFLNSIPLSFEINDHYKNLLYAYLDYFTTKDIALYWLPENINYKKIEINKGQVLNVENEYKNYVFIVQYSNNKVVKSGWVDKSGLKFMKKREIQ